MRLSRPSALLITYPSLRESEFAWARANQMETLANLGRSLRPTTKGLIPLRAREDHFCDHASAEGGRLAYRLR